jgi:hypothetical protein
MAAAPKKIDGVLRQAERREGFTFSRTLPVGADRTTPLLAI